MLLNVEGGRLFGVFRGREIFFCIMLCCSCTVRSYESAWHHSRSIEDPSLNQGFSIHETQCELLTVHSAGHVKRTKLPSVLLSCTAPCFSLTEKLPSKGRGTAEGSSQHRVRADSH